MSWKNYRCQQQTFDEYITENGGIRALARTVGRFVTASEPKSLNALQKALDLAVKEQGITFRVYFDNNNSIDRAWPIDLLPRLISLSEWQQVEQGLIQRITALNHFIDDIYHQQKILKDNVIPKDIVVGSDNYRRQCVGVNPVNNCWVHISGCDLIRDKDGTFFVLEDNLRVPSGVSYMLENRQVVKRILPEVFADASVMPVDDYPQRLYETLANIAYTNKQQPNVVVLTPGIYNSAYFEHVYLAQQMGCELVEGSDLVVKKDIVYMRTIKGLVKVDVIYRRIDDLFLDPSVFNKDSVLGVRGLMRAWKKRNVAIANAPGAGVADDKVIYAYVPEMIRYYLDEEPTLANVPTYLLNDKVHRDHVLGKLKEYVVKPANASGGYGLLVGPKSTQKQRDEFTKKIKKSPRNYIAQPTIQLSTVPAIVGMNKIEPRHVDLRPFVLSSGDQTYVTQGGLTRVALRKGSLVVNSSQGGGSKDTWIVDTIHKGKS